MYTDYHNQLHAMAARVAAISAAQACAMAATTSDRLVCLQYDQLAEWERLQRETAARFRTVATYYTSGVYTSPRHRAQARRLLGGA